VLANNCLYAATTNLTKLSILVQYLRIFTHRYIRWISLLLMSLCGVAATWAIFGGIFLCDPVDKLWKPVLPGVCMNAEQYWLSTAAFNVGLDFAVLILPMPVISRINLPQRQKLALILVFILGGLYVNHPQTRPESDLRELTVHSGSVVSVVRLAIVHIEAKKGHYMRMINNAFVLSSEELTRADSGIASITWSAVEANTGIICASLMALKPWLVRFFPRLMLSNEPARCCLRLPNIPNGPIDYSGGSQETITAVGTTHSIPPKSSRYSAQTASSKCSSRQRSLQPVEHVEALAPMTERPEEGNNAEWMVCNDQ
jgi:hypothetical protein